MALMSRLTQAIHLCFGLPLFLLPGGTISRVFLLGLVSLRGQTTSVWLSWHLSVMFSTFILSLMSSFFTWSLSVWPHAHLHIFISATSSFFTWELYSDWHCLHSVQHIWLDDHFVYLSSNMRWYSLILYLWIGLSWSPGAYGGGGIVLGALRAWLL